MEGRQEEGVVRADIRDNPGLNDFQFFADSPNRIVVLDTLREQHLSRTELVDRLSISRITVKRILDDLEGRKWISQDEQRYRATPLGEAVIEEVLTLFSRLASLRELQEIEQWLPAESERPELRKFCSAEIHLPDRTSPLEPIEIVCEIVVESDSIQALISSPLVATHLLSNWERIFEECSADTVELVLTSDVIAAVSDNDEYVKILSTVAELKDGGLQIFDENPSYSFVIADSTVGLCLGDEQGFPRGMLITEDESIQSWAETTFTSMWTNGCSDTNVNWKRSKGPSNHPMIPELDNAGREQQRNNL